MDHANMHHDMPASMNGHEANPHNAHMMNTQHSHHMPGMNKGTEACSMNMIWNTDIKGMCIVHRAWHVKTERQFVASLLCVVGLAILYEWIKLTLRRVGAAAEHTEVAHGGLRTHRESGPRVSAPRRVMPLSQDDALEPDVNKRPAVLTYIPRAFHTPARLRTLSTCLYGVQVAMSCFLMLIMMTYNAWLIGAIVIGAMIGSMHVRYGHTNDMYASVCH